MGRAPAAPASPAGGAAGPPPRLAVWLLGLRAGVYVGAYSRRTRERIWDEVRSAIGGGNAVLAWTAPNDAGFEFDTWGANRRVPVDLDGFRLVAFLPPNAG